ncbi:hypothetical protein [Paenibacillus beijingensis]|uniref:Methyltransferase n=1 Tax=Paenibacillus beijingensis TaxID=1126833 RepID=A0A0D5NP66_9BACL|nr:hypothetical protein [Paenibacillus beijingensis]AJY77071.1 hypothetical protein VN24_24130 [Paenibacillus beijingensis]
MSRSWERKVRRNTAQMNQKRKKQGLGQLVPDSEKVDRFRGRNYIFPIVLLLIIAVYAFLSTGSTQNVGTTWTTIGLYLLLALMFYLRRPYLAVGADYVQTRRMFGDRRLQPANIKAISVQPGYVVIQPVKGANWVFSRLLYRYPVDEMKERLSSFAKLHNITFEER